LIGSLNESDGKLWTERHHGAAPGLTGGGITEVVGFEIETGRVHKSLSPLPVHI